MTTVTVIPNPQDKDNHESLLYWVTGKGNLAIEHRVLGQTGYTAYRDNTAPKWAGPITIPGQIAAVRHEKSTVVYGFTRTFDIDGKNHDVLAQISPVINPFANYDDKSIKKQNWNALAATTDDHDHDYVYIFRNEEKPADPANPKPVIVEFEALASGGNPTASEINAEPTAPFPNANPRPDSQLAGVWENSPNFGERRTVFFQRREDEATQIWYQHANDQGAPSPISGSNARIGTSIAIVQVPQTDSYTKDVVYLYYIQQTGELMRVTRVNDNWQAPAVLNNGKAIQRHTGLTAIWDKEKANVRVFAQTTATGNAFVQFDDSVARRV